MGIQQRPWVGDLGQMPPALPFADLPAASSVPGQVRRASDLNNAYLVSDGTNWSPLNGRAVIANRHNVNLTVQSLSDALITAEAFPGGFVRAGSRIQVWSRSAMPAISTSGRFLRIRAGSVGGGVANPRFDELFMNTSSAQLIGRTNSEITALGTSGGHRGSRSQAGKTGFYLDNTLNPLIVTADFTQTWEIAFTGQSVAETAQTGVTATRAAGEATFARGGHGYATGDKIVTSGFTPTGYNGTLVVTGAPTPDTWTAAIASDPGAAGTGGSTSRISNIILVDYLIEWLQ